MKILKQWVAMIFAVLASSTAAAQNIGFESGNLNGWTVGDVDVTVSIGVQNVTYGDNKIWTIMPYGTYMGQLYPSGSITFDAATTSLGLTSTENAAIRQFMINNAGGGSPEPTNATWIKRTVNLQAGVTYTFAWNYLSTDYTPFNDGSIMTLVHASNAAIIPTLNNSQQRYALLGFTNPGTGNYSTDSYGSTGWQVAVFTVPVTGSYEFGFATFNLGDTVLSPILFIDELQGTTELNGQPFAPVPPNPGSNAPPPPNTNPELCCGGSATAFNANIAFSGRITNFVNSNADNQIIIQQIGSNSIINAQQVGKKNYIEIISNGSNNDIDIRQSIDTGIVATNYAEIIVGAGINTVDTRQVSSGGTKSILLNVGNTGNIVSVEQNNNGSHYAEITLLGGSKNINLVQNGSAAHMSRIELSGGSTSLTATQSGSIQQYYSITHHCAQISCAAITVTQGQ